MKVHELIELLEEMDPEADVWLMVQPSYPFEHRIEGVCQRSDLAEPDPEAEPWAERDRWGANESQLPATDVFLLDGGQARYGAKAAWDAARRW